MPRNGAFVFSKPSGTTPIDGDTVSAAPFNLLMDDFVSDLNLARPIAVGGTGASTAAAALVNLGLTATAAEINAIPSSIATLSGRNLIINGTGRINQRAYVSGTATAAANQFTLDRWFVVTSGQSLTFTGTGAGRVMTAPAGGVSQVIEGNNIVGGTYVINWVGTATCTVNGTARAKGDTFTLTENTNATVKFTSGTFSEVQVELGSIVTPFERTSYPNELSEAQRYYNKMALTGGGTSTAAAAVYADVVTFPKTMRAAPAVSFSGGSVANLTTSTADNPTKDAVRILNTAAAAGQWNYIARILDVDAEITA